MDFYNTLLAKSLAGNGGGGGGDVGMFVVNFTDVDLEAHTFTADKTYNEILNAYKSGMFVYGTDGFAIFYLYSVEEDSELIDFKTMPQMSNSYIEQMEIKVYSESGECYGYQASL